MTDLLSMKSHVDPLALLKVSNTAPNKPKGDAKMKQAAEDFEAMLMAQLFQTMRKTVEPSGLFSGNENERTTYEYLLDQALAKHAVAEGRAWGLASVLEEAWKNREGDKIPE